MSCKGRVVRRYEDKQLDYYGISFVALETSANEFLRSCLYAEGAKRYGCDELGYSAHIDLRP